MPELGVAASSTRGFPSTSVDGSPLTAESAASIAGDPALRWKSPPDWFTHKGFATDPCIIWPLAFWYAESDV